MHLRKAHPDEAEALSHIAKAAKAHWGYDEALLKLWEPELSYSPQYLRDHWVMVAEEETQTPASSSLLGVCLLEAYGDQLEIMGLWVLPETMGRGVGKRLVDAALEHCKSQQVKVLRLLSDPNAQGFYETLGATLIGHERTSQTGRLLPLMHFNVEPDSHSQRTGPHY